MGGNRWTGKRCGLRTDRGVRGEAPVGTAIILELGVLGASAITRAGLESGEAGTASRLRPRRGDIRAPVAIVGKETRK
jgi:hypothetical protein